MISEMLLFEIPLGPIFDSIGEIHATQIGIAFGIIVAIAIRFGYDSIATLILGIFIGVVIALWFKGLLVYWPAKSHAWYLVLPAAVIAGIGTWIAIRRRDKPVK